MPPPKLRRKLPEEAPGEAAAPGVMVDGRVGVDDGWVGRGEVKVLGADMDREPRLPMERPPPARAQASI